MTPVLRGEVVRGGEPLVAGTVVLHRVTPGEAGEIDSVSVGTDGAFQLRLPHMPDPGARSEVFFASVRHLGILYFGPAISDPIQLDSLYSIEVFDTIVAPPDGAEVAVSVRNLFLEQTEDGWQATDLFQLRNDTDRTYVAADARPPSDASGSGVHAEADAPDRQGAVWSYPLPPGASGFQIGQSDLPPDAVTFEGSTVRVSAPLPPGERLYLVRYLLPELELDLPMPGRTEVMELLILEPLPPLTVEGLRTDQPVELEPGSTYRRYAGSELDDVVITIREAEAERTLPMAWITVILALFLGVAGIYALSKRPAMAGAPPGSGEESAPETRSSIVREIAILDEAFGRAEEPSPAEEARYRARREALMERLREPR
ncbi:MAG: hypothetical protein WDZ89_00665 [Gemmatimonadota bacterium]